MIVLFVRGLLNFHVTFITFYDLYHGLPVALTSANNQKPSWVANFLRSRFFTYLTVATV